ncbi:MAG: response regulator, partial [Proteobacteria bacterium]|nr:response regulator [Pseudomonadota bacterium]
MLHLLVLDDDRGMTALLSMVARDRGWTAETTVTESEFQEHYRARRPDVIMLDLQLGKSDGIEQLRFLGREKYPGNVVLISGFDARVLASAQEIGQGLGLAIVATVSKPIRVAPLR